jgi:chemotaxis response regulator CheB
MTPNKQMIRVLVVDDSALMRKLIPQLIERDSSIHVVGTAMDGAFALKKIEELKPDAITLDLRCRAWMALRPCVRSCVSNRSRSW